jgi:arylformamidase
MSQLSNTEAELERQYNPRVAVPDHAAKTANRAAVSAAVRARLKGHIDVRFGAGPKATVDIFPAATPNAPVEVYFHGGYWRANDKSEVSFVAAPLVAAGACAVIANYDLCPSVTLDELVAETRACIAWCYRHIGAYGGDPERIFVSGSSAGGHIAAMLLAHDWAGDGLPEDLIKGAVLITGVYDVEPVRQISVNEQIRLDAEQARRLSPIHHLPRRPLPLVIAVGGAETPAWIEMSRDYARACADAGVPNEFMLLPGEDHFTMTGRLADAGSAAVRAMLKQMRLAGA